MIGDSRNWSHHRGGIVNGDDEDEEEEDRSLDLLVKFIQKVFKKLSRKARKAVRAVLPDSISTQLVFFFLNLVITVQFSKSKLF